MVYRDPTHIDPNREHQISELAKFIREKMYGKDVRESIALALERVYDDAAQNGNANMELIKARGSKPNLGARLDENEEILNLVERNLAQTATRTYVDRAVREVASGTPKITVSSPQELNMEYPNGSEDNALVTNNGHIYHWNGSAWVDTGIIYQEKGISNNSVTVDKIYGGNQTVNILNKEDLMKGQYYGGGASDLGSPVKLLTSSNWYGTSHKIKVYPGDIVRFNKAFQDGHFIGVDDKDILRFLPPRIGTAGYAEITVPEGVTGFYSAVYKDYLDEAMITINNPMPNEYTPSQSKKVLEWLEYRDKSIPIRALSDEVIDLIQTVTTEWFNKNMVIFGDSIQWQDGRPYASNGQIARGMGTIIKEKLGLNIYDNQGISGRPMANGTDNGDGTNTTIKDYSSFSDKHLIIIAAGTNDFKLDVPLGELVSPKSSSFEDTTFYGAYQEAIEHIVTHNPNSRIVLFTPLHRDNGGYNSWSTINKAGHKLIDYVDAVHKIGELYSYQVVNLYSKSGINKLNLNEMTSDGLHLIDPGYHNAGEVAAMDILQNVPVPFVAL